MWLCVCIDFFFSLFFCSNQSEEDEKNTNEFVISIKRRFDRKFIFMYQSIEIWMCRYASLHFSNKKNKTQQMLKFCNTSVKICHHSQIDAQ